MTRRRIATLVSGIAVLAAVSYWRLVPSTEQTEAPPTSTPAAPTKTADAHPDRPPIAFAGKIFGTTYKVRAIVPERTPRNAISTAVHGALSKVNRLMSTYEPTSEISRLNAAPAKQEFKLSAPLAEVFNLALAVHGETGGAFDVSVTPLVGAWGFGANARSTPPDDAELEELLARVGSDKLVFDAGERTLTKLADKMFFDLGAIAKGYGVDQAARALEQMGSEHYMVEVGGEVCVRGQKAPGRPWVLGIELPSAEHRKLYGKLVIEEGALATSGDYRNFRRVDGQTFSHTLDPRTGRPVPRRTASVSVVSRTTARADALATALSVLPPDEAMALAEKHGWAVMLLLHDGDGSSAGEAHEERQGFLERQSSAFEKLDFRRVAPR